MRFLQDTPIKRKLYLIIMGTVSAVLLLSLGLSMIVQVSAVHDEVASGLESLAKMLGASSRATVVFQDAEAANEVLAALGSQEHVAWARIQLRDGSVFARYGSPQHHPREDAGQPGLSEGILSRLIVVTKPIEVDGKQVAQLHIAGDLSRAYGVLLKQTMMTLGVLLASLTLGLLLASRLQRLVSIPVQRLSAAMHKVAHTRDFSHKAEKFGDDELGRLTDGFNTMLGQIREYDQELTLYRHGLEEQVAERTRELEHAKQQAVAASKAKSEFLATMSHEIRTPLTAVIGFTKLLEETGLDHKQRSYIGIIDSSANVLLDLIDEILDFSKMEAGKLELDNRDFVVEDLLKTIRTTLGERAREKGIRFNIHRTGSVPLRLYGDPLRLRQILTILTDNAVKFTDHGAVKLLLDGANRKDGRFALEIRVSDSGIGISPEQQAQLFEPFQQGDGSITRRFGGTGLGLVIAQRLVELMDGEIKVASTFGEGTTFSAVVHLHLAHDGKSSAPLPSEIDSGPVNDRTSSSELAPVLGNRSVLMVDDNQVNLELATTLLTDRGIHVVGVETASEALEQLHSQAFDLVMMDLEMPGMSGIEATAAIRALHDGAATVPIVAVTAHVFPEQRQEIIQAGMNDLLPKPYLPAQLYAMVSKWCPGEGIPGTTGLTRYGPPANSLVYDPEAAMTFADGSKQQAEIMLHTFLTSLPVTTDAIQATLAAADWDGLYHEVHKLAGSAPVVGATALHGAAARLQDLMKLEPRSVEHIEAGTADLLLQISRFRNHLND